MREFRAVGAGGAGVGWSRCGECVGWVPSVRWMRKFSAFGAVRTGSSMQLVRWMRGEGSSVPLVRWLRGMSDESDGLYAGCGVWAVCS